MHLFRVLRLPLYQAPDAPPAADPAPAVDPATIAPAAGDPPAPIAEAPVDPGAGDPPPAPLAEPAEPKPHGNKGKKPWYLERISEESSEKARERDARLAAEERARNAEDLVKRLQRGGADPAPTTEPRGAEVDVEARAQQIADERLSRNTISGVVSAGVSAFDDWDSKTEMLAAVGAATPAFVLDVASVDPQNAHKILHQLADNPDKAARLAKMDSRARTIELVRMSMALSGETKTEPAAAPPPAKTVSRAPPPPPPVDPGTKKTVPWWDDSVSDADFARGWDENARNRAARGRR